MFKLNLLNKIYAFILVGLIVAIVIKLYAYHGSSRYYYSASCTAPPTYPVYVMEAELILEGNEAKSILYQQVNDGNGARWGDTDLDNGSGSKDRLPVALVIRYASYRDRSFYADSIPLPAKLIADIFKSGAQKAITRDPEPAFQSQPAPLSLLVGIGNNGKIVVWLQGKKYERKLLTRQIKRLKPAGNLAYQDQIYPVTDYFNHFYVTDDYKAAVAKGIDKDANYADSSTHYVEYYQSFN